MAHSPTLAPGNQVQFAPLVDGVTLMRAAFTDHVFERHSHDCFTIGVTVQGIQRFRCKGQRHDSRPGEIVLFNPDDDHDGQRGDSDGFQYATWSLDKAFVLDCLDPDAGLAGTPYFTAPHVRDPALAAAFTQMTLALLETPPHVYLNAVRIGHAQILLRGGMPLADVANACGFADQSHFARRFKGAIGVSPSAWR